MTTYQGFDVNFEPNLSESFRKVPHDLLNINEIKYNDEWAKQTFKYFHLFDTTVDSAAYSEGCEDLDKWKTKGLSMMKELKHRGIKAGRNEVVRIARIQYNLFLPNLPNIKPTNMDDIMTIISDPIWYETDKEIKQNMIYNMMYGLTRTGMNGWLQTEETKWMNEKGISYEDVKNTKRKTKIKGFVYSILQHVFSNSTIKHFQTVMKRQHYEYITVREKKHLDHVCEFISKDFPCGKGYIVKVHKQLQFDIGENDNPTTKICTLLVKKCYEQKMSEDMMHELLDNTIEAIKGKKQDHHVYKQDLPDDMIYCKFNLYLVHQLSVKA